MENLLELDRQLFYIINHLPHPLWFNTLALILSGAGTGGFIWLLAGTILFLRERSHKILFLQLFVAIGVSVFITEVLLKPLFGRSRPGDYIGGIIVGLQAIGNSFPSSHAAAAFSGWYVGMKYKKSWTIPLFLLASGIALSRVYLGRHYPSDILVGSLLGISIGWITLSWFSRKTPNKKRHL